MKNRVSILILLIFLLFSLVACAGDEDNKTDESNTEATQSEQKDVNNEANKPQKDENGNYILDEVGQKVEDLESGTAELLKIKEDNETVDVSPLKVTVTDMKVIKVTDLNADYKEMMEFNTEESIGEDFTVPRSR